MGYLLRHAFRIIAGLLAFVFALFLLLWPDSYLHCVDLSYSTTTVSTNVGYASGRFEVGLGAGNSFSPGFRSFVFQSSRMAPPRNGAWSYLACDNELEVDEHGYVTRRSRWAGILWTTGGDGIEKTATIAVPFSYLTLLIAILPAFWLRGIRRRRRQARFVRRGFPVEPAAPAR